MACRASAFARSSNGRTRIASPTSRSCSTCRPAFRARGSIRAELAGRALDKFEREATPFFTRVRDAYLERAAPLPQRIRVIDSTRPMEVVRGGGRCAPRGAGRCPHDDANRVDTKPRGFPGRRCCLGRPTQRARPCASAHAVRMRCSSTVRAASASTRSRSISPRRCCARRPRTDGLACGACAGCRYAVAGQHPDLMRVELW